MNRILPDKIFIKARHVFSNFKHDKFANGLTWTAGATIAKSIFPFCQYILFARVLTVSDLGLLSIISIIVGFAQIFIDAGLSNAVITQLGSDEKKLSSVFWFHILSGFSIMAVFLIFSPVILMLLKCPQLLHYSLLIGVIFPLLSTSQFLISFFQKKLLFKKIAKADFTSSFSGVFISILMVINKPDIISYIVGLVVTNAVLLAILFKNTRGVLKIKLYFNIRDVLLYFKYGSYQLSERSLNYLSANVDKIIINHFFGLNILGYYNCAYQLMLKPIGIINVSFARVTLPFMSMLAGNYKELNNLLINITKKITFVTFPIYSLMFIFSKEIILFLYGSGFQESIFILQIFSVIGVVWSLGNPIGSYLLSLGKVKLSFLINLYQFVIVLAALLIGAHYSLRVMLVLYVAVTVIFFLPLDFIICSKCTGMLLKHYFDSFGASSLSVAGAGILLSLFRQIHNSGSMFLAILLGCTFMVIYLSLYRGILNLMKTLSKA